MQSGTRALVRREWLPGGVVSLEGNKQQLLAMARTTRPPRPPNAVRGEGRGPLWLNRSKVASLPKPPRAAVVTAGIEPNGIGFPD